MADIDFDNGDWVDMDPDVVLDALAEYHKGEAERFENRGFIKTVWSWLMQRVVWPLIGLQDVYDMLQADYRNSSKNHEIIYRRLYELENNTHVCTKCGALASGRDLLMTDWNDEGPRDHAIINYLAHVFDLIPPKRCEQLFAELSQLRPGIDWTIERTQEEWARIERGDCERSFADFQQ